MSVAQAWKTSAPSARARSTKPFTRCHCVRSTSAPMSMLLSSGSPTRIFAMRAFSLPSSAGAVPSCTSRREPAQQTSPWLNQMLSTMPSTAASRSASANTMYGLLPPSSRLSFLPLPAVAWRMSRPTSVLPVKAILAMPGCAVRAWPTAPSPVTRLNTPAGRPTSWQISANSSAVSDVCSAGLKTMVLPQASAGATFQASISSGKFHGTIWPTTPKASWPGISRASSCAQPAWW